MKDTQIHFVKQELRTKGMISRNFCLSKFVSRLGAIIQKLEYEGWEFKTRREDGNYIYELISEPKPKQTSLLTITR